MTKGGQRRTRALLGGFLAFLALNAIGGGWYGLAGAEGVPTAWLDGSPFDSYVIPSLILLVVVGGSHLFAAVAVFTRARIACASAFIAGGVLVIWIVAQVSIIGYVSWLQPAMVLAGMITLGLAWRHRS